MPDSIKDGNSGNVAKVNKLGELLTLSESVPSEGFQAQDGNAFILHGECHLSASNNGGLMYFKNLESQFNVTITRIYIDAHKLTPDDIIITQVFDATPLNGTDISEVAIVQKNRSANENLNGQVLISDSASDLTYTGGTQYHAFPVKNMTSQQRNMNETNVLGFNNSILWGWKTVSGNNAVDGEVISFSVNVVKRER